MVNTPRAHNEVPDQPDERCPIRGGSTVVGAAILRQHSSAANPKSGRSQLSKVVGLSSVFCSRIMSVAWERNPASARRLGLQQVSQELLRMAR
eukprot:28571-Alexandrium_andersonii.AAC.1